MCVPNANDDCTQPWSAAETLTVTEAVNPIAFTADVTFPPPFTVITPQPDAGVFEITRAAGLAAHWVPIDALLDVKLEQDNLGNTGPFSVMIECLLPGSTGSVNIPASTLQDLLPGPALLAVIPTNNVTVTVPPYTITVSATTDFSLAMPQIL